MGKLEDLSSARSAALEDLWSCIVVDGGDMHGPGDGGRTITVEHLHQELHDQGSIRISGPVAHSLLRRGISSKAIVPLGEFLGVGKAEVADLLEIDRGTVARWAARDQVLPTHAAEGLLRMIELDQLATDTFETEEEARQWLRRPHPLLEGDDPLSAAKTSYGAQRVRDILTAIRYGGVA